MTWNFDQPGWLREAWQEALSVPALPSQFDPAPFILESRFPGRPLAGRPEDTSLSLFCERIGALLQLGAAILASPPASGTKVDAERLILLGLAAALGVQHVVTSVLEADGESASSDTAQETITAIERSLLALSELPDTQVRDTPFHQLLWRRRATRFAFILGDLKSGTFSTRSAIQGHAEELQTRRLMLELVFLIAAKDQSNGRDERVERHIRALEQTAGLATRLPRPSPHERSLDEAIRALAGRLPNHADRSLLLSELYVICALNDDLTETEVQSIRRISDGLSIDPQTRLELQSAVLHAFELQDALAPGFSMQSILSQVRRYSSHAVENLVKKNAAAIGNELRETGDLVQLLAKSTNETLTEDEQRRMKEQMQDLCRAVPCLALFAAPGGSLLIPVLQRLLPINLLPSSFKDAEARPEDSQRATRDDLEAL